MIFFLFKHIICFQDLIQPAAVSDEKSCIQLPAGGQIHHFLAEASVHAACLKDQVLSIHIRQWKDLRLFVHSHDDDNGTGQPGQ